MSKQKTATIIFQPSGRCGAVDKGISIIETSRHIGVDIETMCGGNLATLDLFEQKSVGSKRFFNCVAGKGMLKRGLLLRENYVVFTN